MRFMEMKTAASTAVATVSTRASAGRRRRMRGSPALTLLAVAVGVMMVGLDGTIVAVANPCCSASACPR